ncbi:MAG TPA: UDP-3-O-(3-hydroxymyristoyl)glucosamine N-acyltransferase [Candidatus Binatia bacterium]|jgi:UDP-3-O-[3-hydroxymyristoyl] glucosamine N-acyltransferase
MKVEEIARLLGGKLKGDGTREILGVAGLENAAAGDLTFAEGDRALVRAGRSAAGCILVAEGNAVSGRTTIAVKHPKLALIHAAAALLPKPPTTPGIHPTGVVSSSARLARGVAVGAHAVIEDEVAVGAGTSIGAGVFLGRGVVIGADCILRPRVSVFSAQIGDRVAIHSGAVIGSDGFGYVFADGRHHKFPQLGQVIIEDDVEIGSNTTIDRGALGNTVIGQGSKIDNLVQIAHNVRVGRHCVIAAQTGIAGSVEIGDYVVMGGQVGVGNGVRIEDRAVIGAQAGIPTGKKVRRGLTMWGTPARPLSEFKKTYAELTNLPKLVEKVRELSRPKSAPRKRR